jgi:hypothetical protein
MPSGPAQVVITLGGGRLVCQSSPSKSASDAHWADSATLDCLTFLTRASRCSAVTAVVTCRSDEAPLDAQVAEWLAHVRGGGEVEEIRLGPLAHRAPRSGRQLS